MGVELKATFYVRTRILPNTTQVSWRLFFFSEPPSWLKHHTQHKPYPQGAAVTRAVEIRCCWYSAVAGPVVSAVVVNCVGVISLILQQSTADSQDLESAFIFKTTDPRVAGKPHTRKDRPCGGDMMSSRRNTLLSFSTSVRWPPCSSALSAAVCCSCYPKKQILAFGIGLTTFLPTRCEFDRSSDFCSTLQAARYLGSLYSTVFDSYGYRLYIVSCL